MRDFADPSGRSRASSLPGMRTEIGDRRLQRVELAIRGEEIERRAVLAKRAAGIETGEERIQPLVFRFDRELPDRLRERHPIVSEVLPQLDAAAPEDHDGDHVGRCHPPGDIFDGARERSPFVEEPHPDEIEVQDHEPAAAVLRVAGRRKRKGLPRQRRVQYRRRGLRPFGSRGQHGQRRERRRVQRLVLDKCDLLRPPILGDDEVPGGEAEDRPALLVLHAHRLNDEMHGRAKRRSRLLLLSRNRQAESHRRGQQCQPCHDCVAERMHCAAINNKRIYHLSMVIGHFSFGCKLIQTKNDN